MIKKIPLYAFGILIACLGVALIINSTVGAGPWDILFVTLTVKFGLTMGTWVMIWQAGFLIFNAILLKKRPEIESFITVLLWGVTVDFWMYVVVKGIDLTVSPLLVKWSVFLIGVILIGFGVGIYLSTNLPRMPYDGTMVAISQRFKLSLRVSRLILEGSAVILGILFGGTMGIGTIVIVLLIGSIIQFFNKIANQIVDSKLMFRT
ncbi:putative membrane protein YczE [Peribacillus deserti]|uniref:Membrane protein YczE n=1 Tax=Peribacillus deserti TaxID=673318 RepID=A0ABS2QG39_9BACI|nr:BCR, YitT family protein [Peribacillus deserti]MBM7692113.1 putative membrane protein YczE [Peribacillus deserti]